MHRRLHPIAFGLLLLVLSPLAAAAQSSTSPYKLAVHVDDASPATINLALNNVQNVLAEFAKRGERIDIEVVAIGPGLHMLRDDTSPVKARIAALALENPGLTFTACGNTQANQSKAEGKPVTLIGEAKVQPSGAVRLIELQRQGYAYLKP